MIIIEKSQLARLQDREFDRFVERMACHVSMLRTETPLTEEVRLEKLKSFVLRCLDQAGALSLSAEDDLRVYIEACVILGEEEMRCPKDAILQEIFINPHTSASEKAYLLDQYLLVRELEVMS